MNRTEAEVGSEFLWVGHFNDRNVSAIIFSFGVRTFADLAGLRARQLAKAGLEEGEVEAIKQLLVSRGLHMRE